MNYDNSIHSVPNFIRGNTLINTWIRTRCDGCGSDSIMKKINTGKLVYEPLNRDDVIEKELGIIR
jgi:hypothetical protein